MKASAFLADFRAAIGRGEALDVFAGDSSGFAAAAADRYDDLSMALGDAVRASDGGPVEVAPAAWLGAALDGDGRVIAGDFEATPALAALTVRAAVAGRAFVAIVGARVVMVAPAAVAAGWPLPGDVTAALHGAPGRLAALALADLSLAAAARAGRAMGLATHETRLVAALADCGALPEAATASGIRYTTARATLADAMAKAGVRRQAELVQRFLHLVAGDLGLHRPADARVAAIFGLSPRQLALARLVAGGASRDEAAAAAGVGAHVAKAELKIVFAACGACGAAMLARRLAEVDLLSAVASATDIAVLPGNDAAMPLKIIARRRAGGRIAFDDHGPRTGAVVVFVHAAMMGRHLPRVTVAALTAAGFRILALDRPGYALTDPVAGGCPFAAAADDAAEVLDALGVATALVVARCASTGVTLGARHPLRFPGGLLLNPGPIAGADLHHVGVYGRLKRSLHDDRLLTTTLAMMSRWATHGAILRGVRQSVADSPADVAALRDPQIADDIVRGIRQGVTHGGRGCLGAEAALRGGWTVPAVPESRRWMLVAGDDDPLHSFGDAAPDWCAALPDAAVVRSCGHGRYLHVTDPGTVVAALAKLAAEC